MLFLSEAFGAAFAATSDVAAVVGVELHDVDVAFVAYGFFQGVVDVFFEQGVEFAGFLTDVEGEGLVFSVGFPLPCEGVSVGECCDEGGCTEANLVCMG